MKVYINATIDEQMQAIQEMKTDLKPLIVDSEFEQFFMTFKHF